MKTHAAAVAYAMLLLQGACSTTAVEGGSGKRPPPPAGSTDSSTMIRAVPEAREQLAKSREAWRALLAAKGPRYSYGRAFQSWTGFGYQTTLVVNGNQVVERRYSEAKQDSAGGTSMGETWTENGSAVGTHEHGHPAVTIDALYEQCEKDLERLDPSKTLLYFRLGGDGVLRSCTTVAKGCADDCSQGVSIDWVSVGN